MEFRYQQIVINAVKESVPSPERGEVADNFILLKFNLYKYFAYRPSPRPGCPIRWDSRTHLGGRDFWVDLAGIKKIPSEYRRRCRRLFSEHLATTDVPQDKHALAISELFELVDEAVDTDLPINLEIFDVTWHNSRMVPATREFIEGLERVRLEWLNPRHAAPALANSNLFELVNAAVDTELRNNMEIFDVSWHNRRTVPATRESIEGLERVRLDRLGLEEEEPCAICWRDYDQHEQLVTRLPCSHYYHEDCIVKWLQINHVCPMCRFAMPPSI